MNFLIPKNKVIKDKNQSVYGGVVSCWSGIKLVKWKERFILNAAEYDFPIHKSYKNLVGNNLFSCICSVLYSTKKSV